MGIAPKLTQTEEVYALSLSDAIGELFGEEVAEFARGESPLSVESVQLVLGAVQSGILADKNLLNGGIVKTVLQNLGTLLNSLPNSGNGGSMNFAGKLKELISDLND